MILLKVIGILIVAVLILNLFVHRYDAVLEAYRTKWLPFALEHGTFVIFTCIAAARQLAMRWLAVARTPSAVDAVVAGRDWRSCYVAARFMRGREHRSASRICGAGHIPAVDDSHLRRCRLCWRARWLRSEV